MRYVSNAFAAPQLCLNDGRRIELEDATFGGESSQDAAEIDEASSQGFFSSSQPTSITELIYGKNRIGRGTPKLPRQATADHDTDPDEWSPDEGDEEEGDMLGLPPTLQDMLRGDPHTGSNDDQTASTDWRTGPTSMRPDDKYKGASDGNDFGRTHPNETRRPMRTERRRNAAGGYSERFVGEGGWEQSRTIGNGLSYNGRSQPDRDMLIPPTINYDPEGGCKCANGDQDDDGDDDCGCQTENVRNLVHSRVPNYSGMGGVALDSPVNNQDDMLRTPGF